MENFPAKNEFFDFFSKNFQFFYVPTRILPYTWRTKMFIVPTLVGNHFLWVYFVFEIFENFLAKNEFFDFFRKKTPSFDVAGNFKRESKSFPCYLYSAEFAFYSARNPRSLSDFVLTQQVQGCARKGVFQ